MTATSHISKTGPVRGAVTQSERALAPDLARGASMLIIALANSAVIFFATVPGVNRQPAGAEALYNLFLFTFVHARGLPLFAMMFGYALVQQSRRQIESGATHAQTRAVLLRRNAWLFIFGAAHGLLLFDGDILGAYGIIGVAFAVLVLNRGDRFIRVAGLGYLGFTLAYLVALAALTASSWVAGDGANAPVPVADYPVFNSDSYLASVAMRLANWPVQTATFLSLFLFIFVGAWAARQQLLERPESHLAKLRIGAIGGLSISIAGGLPMGLHAAGYIGVGADTTTWMRMLYETSGFFGGIGYGCLFGLVAARLARRAKRNIAITAVAALGQRTLSGYLAQSVVWIVLASPFLLDLTSIITTNSYTVTAVGFAVWLATVVAAYVMHRRSYRGPAELLLRRLTYRPHTATPRRDTNAGKLSDPAPRIERIHDPPPIRAGAIMVQIVIFHHAQGLTAGVQRLAQELRDGGHVVDTPDLYDGNTFDSLDDGIAYAQKIGFGVIAQRGKESVAHLPDQAAGAATPST